MITPPRSSKSKQLADAVAAWIRDHFALEVKSLMTPNFESRKFSSREIACWPVTRNSELLNRGCDQQIEYEIGVGVIEPIKSDSDDGEDLLSDELLALVESIGDGILGEEFTTSAGTATVVGSSHTPLFDAEWLERKRLFAGGIAIQLTRIEEKPT